MSKDIIKKKTHFTYISKKELSLKSNENDGSYMQMKNNRTAYSVKPIIILNLK